MESGENKEQVQVQQLQAEKEKFFQVVSKWLGSPLRSLHLLTEMVASQRDGIDPEQLAEFHFHIHNQVGKLNSLMENLIAWADLETDNYRFNPKPIRLAPIFELLKKDLAPIAAKKDIDISFAVDPNLHVTADKRFLQLALTNLITNAIKFTPAHEAIRWEAHDAEDGSAKLIIIDPGIGMGPSKLSYIFNPARPANQKGTANEDGMGIGLVLTKKIIELHASTLQLVSERGKGTQASFALPTAAEQ